MKTEESVNPYSPPQPDDEPSVVSSEPSRLAHILVEVVASVVGVCTWFCTSTVFMAVGFRGPEIISGVSKFLGIALPIPAAVFVFYVTRRKLLSRLSQRRESGEGK
jgi:hypothetical protein